MRHSQRKNRKEPSYRDADGWGPMFSTRCSPKAEAAIAKTMRWPKPEKPAKPIYDYKPINPLALFSLLWALLAAALTVAIVFTPAKARSQDVGYYAQQTYANVSGTTTTFAIPFPYLNQPDINVYVNGALQTQGTAYTFLTTSTIAFTTAPAAGVTVQITRTTSAAAPEATFHGGALASADLNSNALQAVYLAQELSDRDESIAAGAISVTSSLNLSGSLSAQSLSLNNVGAQTQAIQLGQGQYVQWFTSSSTPTSKIISNVSVAADLTSVVMDNTGFNVQNQSGVDVLNVSPSGTATVTGPIAGGSGASSGLSVESTTGSGTSDFIKFYTGSQVEAFEIDTSGYLIGPGLTTHLTSGGLTYSNIQCTGGPVGAGCGIAAIQHSNDTSSAAIGFYKTRSTSAAGNTIVQSGDDIGELNYNASTASGYTKVGYADVVATGTVSGSTIPTFWEFANMNPSGTLQTNLEIDPYGNLSESGEVCANVGWTGPLVNTCPATGVAGYMGGLLAIAVGQGLTFNLSYSGGYKYIASGYGISVAQVNGDLVVYTAPSGSASGSATATERFRVSNSGVISVNGTAGVTCSGTPSSSFASVNGIVTHC